MRNLSYVSGLGLALVLSMGLSGCGGGGGGSSTTTPTTNNSNNSSALTGTFADAPVQGLYYKTTTQSGFTDADGHFKYLAGEKVEFKLGNLILGKGVAGVLVTPYTISENNDTATNIALLLQNFDGNRSNSKVLDVSKLKDANFTDVNLSVSTDDMETKINNLFNNPRFSSYISEPVIDASKAKTVMDNYIKAQQTNYIYKLKESDLSGYELVVSITSLGTTKFYKNNRYSNHSPKYGDTTGSWSITNDGKLKLIIDTINITVYVTFSAKPTKGVSCTGTVSDHSDVIGTVTSFKKF